MLNVGSNAVGWVGGILFLFPLRKFAWGTRKRMRAAQTALLMLEGEWDPVIDDELSRLFALSEVAGGLSTAAASSSDTGDATAVHHNVAEAVRHANVSLLRNLLHVSEGTCQGGPSVPLTGFPTGHCFRGLRHGDG